MPNGIGVGGADLGTDPLSVGGIGKNKISISGNTVFPTTTSVSSGGWNVSGDTLISQGQYSFGGKRMTRFTANNTNPNYCLLRRAVSVNMTALACGRIDIPVLIPGNYAAGGEFSIIVSKDNPAQNPPTATPANYSTFTFINSHFKRGQITVLSVDLSSTAANSPTGSGWVNTGTVTPADMFQTLYFSIYCPIPNGIASTTNDNWFEIGDIQFNGFSTPTVVLFFDGAGQDPGHVHYVLPLLDKFGIKASFSVQGQVPTVNFAGDVERIKLIHSQGHDICNEGLNHTNYATNPATLLADMNTAKANFASIGVTRGVDTVWAAAQNILLPGTLAITNANPPTSAGVSDLAAAGYRFIRSGGRRVHNPVTSGNELINIGPFPSTDGATAATLISYLDVLEMQGGTGCILFHSIVPTVSGINQTALSEFTAFINELGLRIGQNRIRARSATQYIDDYYGL